MLAAQAESSGLCNLCLGKDIGLCSKFGKKYVCLLGPQFRAVCSKLQYIYQCCHMFTYILCRLSISSVYQHFVSFSTLYLICFFLFPPLPTLSQALLRTRRQFSSYESYSLGIEICIDLSTEYQTSKRLSLAYHYPHRFGDHQATNSYAVAQFTSRRTIGMCSLNTEPM